MHREGKRAETLISGEESLDGVCPKETANALSVTLFVVWLCVALFRKGWLYAVCTVDLEAFVAWVCSHTVIVVGTWGRGITLLWLAGCSERTGHVFGADGKRYGWALSDYRVGCFCQDGLKLLRACGVQSLSACDGH